MTGHSVLITGGAGFIGKAIATALTAKEFSVCLLDNFHPQVHEHMAPLDGALGRVLVGDISSLPHVCQALELARPDIVIHLAAETGTAQSLTEPVRHVAVNALGTAVLSQAMDAVGCRPEKLLLASSRAVYGEGLWTTSDGSHISNPARTHDQLQQGVFDVLGNDGNRAEFHPHKAGLTPPAPVSVYGATKLCQENLLKAWSIARDVPLTILRLQNVYGRGQSPTNPYTGIISIFVRFARQGLAIPVFEDGAILRDFVNVRDVVLAFQQALASPSHGVFDVGAGTSTTILSLASQIASMCDAPRPIVTGEFRDGDVRAAFADLSDISSSFGFEAKVSLSEGLEELLAPDSMLGT